VVGYAGLVWIALAPVLAAWGGRAVVKTTLLTAACVWTADLLATAIKAVTGRARPFETVPEADPLLAGTVGDSLPSGHAATSFAGFVLLALLVRRARPALFTLALLVSFSRVYVGVHYPIDVVAGAVLGAAVAVGLAVLLRAPPRLSAARRRSAGAPRRG
jgi:undecaprenyl-diphosphatase